MRRRRMMIGFASLVLGSSGFIASGAFDFGSDGSEGDWLQVATTPTEFDEEPDPATDTESDEDLEMRLEFVADDDRTTSSGFVKQDGSLVMIDIDRGTNVNAISRIGTVRPSGYPDPTRDRVAFLIVNAGAPLRLRVRPDGTTPEIRFPSYLERADGRPGERVNLHDEVVQLSLDDVVYVVVEIDTLNVSTSATVDVEQILVETERVVTAGMEGAGGDSE